MRKKDFDKLVASIKQAGRIKRGMGWTPFSRPKQGTAKVEPARLKTCLSSLLCCFPEATEGSLRKVRLRRDRRLVVGWFFVVDAIVKQPRSEAHRRSSRAFDSQAPRADARR